MTSQLDEESVGREPPKVFMKEQKNDRSQSIKYAELL